MNFDSAPETIPADVPRYRITRPAYFDREVIAWRMGPGGRLGDATKAPGLMLGEGDELLFDGIPGVHMVPLNKAATEAWERYTPVFSDPVEALPIAGEASLAVESGSEPVEEPAESPPQMHQDASSDAQPRCRQCGTTFTPSRAWAVFCKAECRRTWHRENPNAAEE